MWDPCFACVSLFPVRRMSIGKSNDHQTGEAAAAQQNINKCNRVANQKSQKRVCARIDTAAWRDGRGWVQLVCYVGRYSTTNTYSNKARIMKCIYF